MTKEKSNKESKPIFNEESILKGLEPIANALKVAVSELWGIFVRQYVVKGLSELFTAFILTGIGLLLKDQIHYFSLIPVAASILLVYDSINLLGNPKYYALEDITKKMQAIRNEK